MSDFLVNLARRSIGLGSMIEVRTDPTDALTRAGETAAPDAGGRGVASPPSRDRIVEVAVPQVAEPPSPRAPGAERQAPAIAALPEPVIQRLTVAAPAIAPAVAVPPFASSLAGQSEPQAPRLVPASVGETERPALRQPAAFPASHEAAPLTSRTIEYHVQSTLERAVTTPAVAEIAPRSTKPAFTSEEIEPRVRVVHDAPVTEHVIAPHLAVVPAVAVAPSTPPRHDDAPHRTEAAPPERTIHVRIGAIEINGSEPPPPTPAGPPPPAAAPPQGFDDFVHLRTYAHWAR